MLVTDCTPTNSKHSINNQETIMSSTTIYTPFTYCITFLPTGQRYYGVRYAKGCHPSQLWTTYFTSSKIISNLIEEYSKDSFAVEVRKTFTNRNSALNWETKFLTKINAANHPEWLNGHNGDLKWNNVGGYKLTKKTLSNMRKPKSESHKQNMRTPKSNERKLSERTKCFEKTGYYSNFDNPDIIQKCKDSYFQNTGYTHNSKNPETIQKRSDSYFEKTGYTNPSKNPEVLAHQYDSYLDKTGYTHPSLNPEVQERKIQTYKDTCSKRPPIKCPYCDVSGKGGIMGRWHFDNCKFKPLPTE